MRIMTTAVTPAGCLSGVICTSLLAALPTGKSIAPVSCLSCAEVLCLLIPSPCFLHVRVDAQHTKFGKHDWIVGCSKCQCRSRITGLRRALENHPRGDDIA